MPKNRKKTSRREILLAALTVVTTLVTALGTGIGAYSSWQATQQTVRQASMVEESAQVQDLLTRLESAEQALPMCNVTSSERTEIDSTLTKAIKELKINADTKAAQALFDSVREKLVNCPLLTSTQSTTFINYEVSLQIQVFPSLIFLVVMALVSLSSAVLWYREHRRNRAVT